MNRIFCSTLVSAMAALGCFAAPRASGPTPNIVVIVSDNQPWWAMGCAGNRIISTPHLDRLAKDGTRFPNAFATTPICAASRASLFTGLYRRGHGFTFNTKPFAADLAAASYPALLRKAGYRTALIGKFGLESNGKLMIEDEQRALASMFDHFDNFEHWGKSGPKGYFVTQPDGSKRHLTDVTGDKAVTFLKGHAEEKRSQPFCLTLCFNAPHAQDDDPRQYIWPPRFDSLYQDDRVPLPENSDPAFFEALPPFLKTSLGRERWRWRFDTPKKYQSMMKGMMRMVSGVDDAVGRLRAELKRLGLDRNTIVFFTSDNGMFFGERGLSDCWLLYEESIRVPLILYDPRADSPSGRDRLREEMILNIDLAPTILRYAGLKELPRMDGRDFGGMLATDRPKPWRRDFLCEHLFEHEKIPKSVGVRGLEWKYIRYFEEEPLHEELYHLKSDPHESTDLARDPRHAQDLERMRRRCDALIAAARPGP